MIGDWYLTRAGFKQKMTKFAIAFILSTKLSTKEKRKSKV
jgi:hypothetical protein